jgi:hypothetical protein
MVDGLRRDRSSRVGTASLIYVGGYGHSGSTLLEYLMTGCADCVACGEVLAATHAEGSRKCTCQRPVAQCPVWSFVADPSLNVAHWSHEALDAELVDQARAKGACIVDSSKTAWRGAITVFKLQRIYSDEFRLVHIVRDPRAVCWSLLLKHKRSEARSNDVALSIETTLGWLYANFACELFRRRHPGLYIRVRYEDLAIDPRSVMTSMLRTIRPSARWTLDAVGTCDNRHQLYGNRMRRKPLEVQGIRIDDKWRTEMPDQLRQLVEAISWPLRARYGYT